MLELWVNAWMLVFTYSDSVILVAAIATIVWIANVYPYAGKEGGKK